MSEEEQKYREPSLEGPELLPEEPQWDLLLKSSQQTSKKKNRIKTQGNESDLVHWREDPKNKNTDQAQKYEYQCPACQKWFGRLSSLKKYLVIHCTLPGLLCTYKRCRRWVHEKGNILKHFVRKHGLHPEEEEYLAAQDRLEEQESRRKPQLAAEVKAYLA